MTNQFNFGVESPPVVDQPSDEHGEGHPDDPPLADDQRDLDWDGFSQNPQFLSANNSVISDLSVDELIDELHSLGDGVVAAVTEPTAMSAEERKIRGHLATIRSNVVRANVDFIDQSDYAGIDLQFLKRTSEALEQIRDTI